MGDNDQLLMSLGKLTGAVDAMNDSLGARIADIRSDIARLEAAQNGRMDRIEAALGERINHLENNIEKRVDGLDSRVSDLEAEDKRMIALTAKLAATGGIVSAMLVAGAVELAKRLL